MPPSNKKKIVSLHQLSLILHQNDPKLTKYLPFCDHLYIILIPNAKVTICHSVTFRLSVSSSLYIYFVNNYTTSDEDACVPINLPYFLFSICPLIFFSVRMIIIIIIIIILFLQ
ncbi:hypothetical protein Dimus_016239 [Dionaea muscipula]